MWLVRNYDPDQYCPTNYWVVFATYSDSPTAMMIDSLISKSLLGGLLSSTSLFSGILQTTVLISAESFVSSSQNVNAKEIIIRGALTSKSLFRSILTSSPVETRS